MDYKQLEIFVAVVETGSFSRAGERQYLSQPAVTAQINTLETELGQQLLIRGNRGVSLTEGGQTLYEFAVNALHQREEVLFRLVKDRPEAGHLRIAASSVPAQYLLPRFLSSFQKQNPNLRTKLVFCDSTEVGRKLSQGQADLGFSGCCSFDARCEYLAIADDPLVVITPDSERFNGIDQDADFPLELLLSEPLIVRESGSGTQQEFHRFLHRKKPGIEPRVVAMMEDTLSIKNAVAAGMGLAVISGRSAANYVKLGYIRAFPLEGGAKRSLYLVHLKKHQLLGISNEFYHFVLKHKMIE